MTKAEIEYMLKKADNLNKDYVYKEMHTWADVFGIDYQEIDYWYAVFQSYLEEEMSNRIETGDVSQKIDIQGMLDIVQGIIFDKYDIC